MQLDTETFNMFTLILIFVAVFLWTQRNNKKSEPEVVEPDTIKDPDMEDLEEWKVIYRKFVPKYYGLAGSHCIYCCRTFLCIGEPEYDMYSELSSHSSNTVSGIRYNTFQFFPMKDLGYDIYERPMTKEQFEKAWRTTHGAGLVHEEGDEIPRNVRKQYVRVERKEPVL